MTEHTILSARSASVTVVAQVIARAVSLLAVVGSTAIVARTVGVDTYADWATVLTLNGLVAFLLDPGISPVVVRRLAQDPAQAPSPDALGPMRLAVGAVALAVVTAIAVGLRGEGVAVLAVALGAQLLPRALVLNATPWLQLDHRLHRQTALEAVTAILGLSLLSLAALADAPAPVLGLVGFTAPTTILAVLVQRELARTPSRARDVPGPQRERVRSLLIEIAPLALALALLVTTTRTFVFFLNRTASSAEVARFLLAFQVIEQVIVVAGIVAGALLPLLAVYGAGREARLVTDESWHDLGRLVAAVGALVSAALIAFAEPFARIVGGSELAAAARDLERLAPMGAVIFPSFVIAYVYVSAGLGRRYLYFNAIALLANVIANLLLIADYGPPMSARITWGSEALVVAMGLMPVLRASRSGALTAAAIAATITAAAVAAELAAAGHVPAPVAGAVLAAAALAAFGRVLRSTALSVLRGPGSPAHARAGSQSNSP
jgi:O-antigen/teichoic acid export membrane protein